MKPKVRARVYCPRKNFCDKNGAAFGKDGTDKQGDCTEHSHSCTEDWQGCSVHGAEDYTGSPDRYTDRGERCQSVAERCDGGSQGNDCRCKESRCRDSCRRLGCAVVIILLICLVGFVAGSCYGIFFSTETDEGISVTQAVEQLNGAYEERLRDIKWTVPHDRLEMIANDGELSIHWPEVLSVFAADVSGAEDGEPVVVLDAELLEKLKSIFWQMSDVQYATRTETHEEEVTTIDDNGNEVTIIQTVSEVILTISITHKTAAEMVKEYHFSSRQKEYLELMLQPENQELWELLLMD